MANNANVDTQAMAAASAIYTDHIGTHRTAHGSIGTEVQVLAARWTGEASTVFVTRTMRQWLDVYQKVISRLETMRQSLDDNSGLYVRTNAQTVETAGSPLSGLPGI
ncbi:WXG100 family type VII secretion target [Micromonospora sp. WMMA1363]|uniref:WXG100 family type VII secretion target n=1 Tax=Micromonospora sp. WMMA1363 TaxID=3053985 RepID=UPI00259C7ACD|nr:WXG100 family type VII secretion target [Micromonospora sp. WMMA1363]MDM4721486.1 WXG100 family type VII secretion target [Micromonospora sp. WMMA1363]